MWLAAGTVLLSLQCLGMYISIGDHGSATVTNILYGSRCLWSVILVWILGVSDGSRLTPLSGYSLMGKRLGGAFLLFIARALVLS
jgi:hypothetical protein